VDGEPGDGEVDRTRFGGACRELVELVTDYLDDALPPPERAAVEAHLDECPDCVEYLEQFRTVIATTGMVAEENLPAEVLDRLSTAFTQLLGRRPPPGATDG
jgi:anti-sigma factor RsiW